jgi:Capsule polysaccharide biosynthesis protein
MIRVLFIDRSWPVVADLVRKFADLVKGSEIHVLFLSDKEPSAIHGHFEILNIRDVPQRRSLEEMQAYYSFSLHKTLVTERAFYDYSSFRRSQCYSRLSEKEVAERVTPFANAFDFVIREKVDLVMEWFPDCFIPSLAGKIAAQYNKPFRMILQHYWWNDGAFFIDRMDLTSAEVDRNYRECYAHPERCDRERLDNLFKTKKTLYAFSSSDMYTWSMRARLILNRRRSYEPPSVRNWIVRRISKVWSANLIRTFIPRHTEPQNEPFVLYPLHTSPEAALLGSYPELADQFGLIKDLSMNLPFGVKLYVKEHPLGDLGLGLDYDFYRRLTALPNVRIIRGDARLDKLIEHPRFLAVAILTGTVGLDAAIKRKPVFIFGRAIYAAADCFIKPTDFEDFHRHIQRLLKGEFQFNERALYAMLHALDASIVRTDVDFLASPDAPALLQCFPPIWHRYIESREWEIDANDRVSLTA